MERVYGVVSRVTYYDESKGFGIIRLKLDYKDKEMVKYRSKLFSNQLTVLSSFDRKPILDEEFEFTGEFETSSYGLQLKAKTFHRRNEQSKEGIVTYLSSDYFPGIGKVAATRVVEALGNDCIKLIVADRTVLDGVDLTDKQRTVLYDNLVIHEQNDRQLIELLNVGISMRMAIRITKILGLKAYETVKNNPYQLIDLIEGIGFLRADGIAMGMGIAKDSPLRLKSLLLYVLENYIHQNGNTFLHLNELYLEARKFVNTDEELLHVDNYRSFIHELVKEEKLVIDEESNAYDVKLYQDEYEIAKSVHRFLSFEQTDVDFEKIPSALKRVMEHNKIEYSGKQIEAITTALQQPMTIITGGPGTGKSTIIKAIVDTYCNLFPNSELVKEQVYLCAPTGRAAKRLMEVTQHKAQTIHKLLGYEGKGIFSISRDEPLDCRFLIVDEFSMVDVSLASQLFASIKQGTRVVIVGDADQLPSVGPGNVLKDLIDSKEVTTVKLEQIHRQVAGSSIVTLAHHINRGDLPQDLLAEFSDRRFVSSVDEDVAFEIERAVDVALNEGYDLIKDIQVLIPMYKGTIGIDALNFQLQERFNKTDEEITFMGRRFRLNDKVIQLVNRSEKLVMNGDIGFILTIERDRDKFTGLTVLFDVGPVKFERDELEDLSLAYAISIHKSQGSEFPVVVIPMSFKYYMMLKRKLIYTAITRAKKQLVMIGNPQALRRGIVQLEDDRQTKLVSRIQEIFENPNKITNPFIEIEETSEELENISPYDFM